MTPIPPFFITQMEEQKKWDDGFKAGIAEVIDKLDSSLNSDELDGPTKEWLENFSKTVSRVYL
jgi:hypothetical protein